MFISYAVLYAEGLEILPRFPPGSEGRPWSMDQPCLSVRYARSRAAVRCVARGDTLRVRMALPPGLRGGSWRRRRTRGRCDWSRSLGAGHKARGWLMVQEPVDLGSLSPV